jgi:hypothetical protein
MPNELHNSPEGRHDRYLRGYRMQNSVFRPRK